MELSAAPTRAPWFHGEAGHSPKSEGGAASFYYSHPRLEVTGSVGLGGASVGVAGSGWMDREFGSSWLAADQTGWDWFGLNLEDGRDVMLYLLRRRDGSLSYADGTLRDADGRTSRRVRGADVEVLETWMPPDLAANVENARPYPAGWRVRLPGEDLELVVRPLLQDQENRRPAGQAGPDIPYWEGAVRVEAAGSGAAGVPPGRGFVELTGYRSDLALAGLAPDTIEGSSDAREGRQDTMMQGLMDGVTFIFRWLHIFVGIIWIGHLYFFNFVNAQMTAKLDGATKAKVVPELMPRALYWFRWGAAWTWITGVVLLLLVFWHGGLMFDPGDGWGGGAIAMALITFVAVFVYDALWNSGLKSNVRAATIVSFLLLAVTVFLFVEVGAFTPRGGADPHRRHVRNHDGLQRLVPHLAGPAADHRGGEGRRSPGRRRPGARRAALEAQHLHVAAAPLGDGERARHAVLRRQLRDPRRLLLGSLAGDRGDRLARHLPVLPDRRPRFGDVGA